MYAKALLEDEIEGIKNQWAVGEFSHESIEKAVQLNAEANGRLLGLFYALDLLDDLHTDEEDENAR